jgi:hypothetical protein
VSGTYRALFTGFVDNPRYQRLSTPARLVLLTLMASAERGPTGLFRYHLSLIAERTGLAEDAVQLSLEELEMADWVVRDRDAMLLWVVNALRDDPTHRPNNANHVRAVEKALRGLPETPLVAMFCKHYGIPMPYPMGSGSHLSPTPNPIPIPTPNPSALPSATEGLIESSNGPGPGHGGRRVCRCGFKGSRTAVDAHACLPRGIAPAKR